MLYHFTKKDKPHEAAWTADQAGLDIAPTRDVEVQIFQQADPEKMTDPDWQVSRAAIVFEFEPQSEETPLPEIFQGSRYWRL